MRTPAVTLIVVIALWSFAGAAFADGDVSDELRLLRQRVERQERRLRDLEGAAPAPVDLSAAVERYLGAMPSAALVGGAGAGGKAGWPSGKRPFLQEGPNKLEIGFRNQVRYETFLYSDEARATAVDDSRPKDRSGFEIETLLLDFQGTIFCPDITFRLMLNFDSDSVGGIEKRWAWLDWRYAGDHHVRAGQQKVVFGFEDCASAATLMFVDRNLVTKAFGLNYDTGVAFWGTFGDACEPKRFRYALEALNGEGRSDAVGSVFADATDKYSDQPLFAAMFEWNVTGKDWAWDEVDTRACQDRCRLDASVGISGHYENDNDRNLPSGVAGSLAVKGNGGVGPLTRRGGSAWFRAQWRGFSLQSEYYRRSIDFTAGSTAADQTDDGAYVQAHYRFAESNWGVGAKYAVIRADAAYYNGVLKDRMSEFGFAVNYFFWDHAQKLTFDASRVHANGGVSSSGPGYLVGATKGVVLEDGWLLRLQWQMNF